MRSFKLDLHLVTDRGVSRGRELLEIVRAAVAGGVSLIRWRWFLRSRRLLIPF
jgi:thiamine-phosphate pyrophosphorylase